MKTGPQPTPRFKMIKLDIIAAFVLLILVIIFSVWYSHHQSKPAVSSSNLPEGWSQFQSTKYGFKFEYPTDWGSPQVAKTIGKTGHHYDISFQQDAEKKSSNAIISISLDSNDYTKSVCPKPKACQTINISVTSKNITSDLKSTSNYAASDNNSYAFITHLPAATELIDKQIISLPKLNVSAGVATYILGGNSKCPTDKFAAGGQSTCITRSDYSKINQLMKSIKEL